MMCWSSCRLCSCVYIYLYMVCCPPAGFVHVYIYDVLVLPQALLMCVYIWCVGPLAGFAHVCVYMVCWSSHRLCSCVCIYGVLVLPQALLMCVYIWCVGPLAGFVHVCIYICIWCVGPLAGFAHVCIYICIWCVVLPQALFMCVYIWCVGPPAGFVDKNNNLLFRSLKEAACTSRNLIILDMFPESELLSQKRPPTVHYIIYIHAYIHICIHTHMHKHTPLLHVVPTLASHLSIPPPPPPPPPSSPPSPSILQFSHLPPLSPIAFSLLLLLLLHPPSFPFLIQLLYTLLPPLSYIPSIVSHSMPHSVCTYIVLVSYCVTPGNIVLL